MTNFDLCIGIYSIIGVMFVNIENLQLGDFNHTGIQYCTMFPIDKLF